MSVERLNSQIDRPTEPMTQFGISPKAAEMLAKLGFPNGATGECRECGKEREYSFEEVKGLLTKSLPKHCDKQIELRTK